MKNKVNNTRGLPLIGTPRNETHVDRTIFYNRLKGIKEKTTQI
jgi:hypothetical protein